jgi:aldehyde:ferredoxin oxidoreductase
MTAEEETINKIKFLLSQNNEAQAIRTIEQYGYRKVESNELYKVKEGLTAEEFIQSKGVFHHPRIENFDNNDSFDVAELMEEYAEAYHQEKINEEKIRDDNGICLHCDGWGYTVDENGRRKEHCNHCE